MASFYYGELSLRRPRSMGTPKKGIDFFKEIEAPEIMEILSEEFGIFPFDCMEKCGCAAYGGAVRDAVAGLPIGGDLDIATQRGNHKVVLSMFDENPKFARCVKQKLKDGTEKTVWMANNSPGGMMGIVPKIGYGSAKNVPISEEDRFLRYDGAEINLVQARRFKDSKYEDYVNVVLNVDMVCCGLAMDGSGRIYEIVEGAWDDCKNRVLRLNPSASAAISVERTEERIKRLEKRGWKSEIDLSDLKKREEQAQKMKKAERAKTSKRRRELPSDEDHLEILTKKLNAIKRRMSKMKVGSPAFAKEMEKRKRVEREMTQLNRKLLRAALDEKINEEREKVKKDPAEPEVAGRSPKKSEKVKLSEGYALYASSDSTSCSRISQYYLGPLDGFVEDSEEPPENIEEDDDLDDDF